MATAPLAYARLGVVRTRDGHTYEGATLMEANGTVTVVPTNAPRVRIPPDNFVQLTLRPETGPGSTMVPSAGALPAPWIASPAGGSGVMGSAQVAGSGFEIQGSGVEACYFVHQPLAGNGEIVARISQADKNSPQAMAGIMLRQNLTSESALICLAVTADGRGALQMHAAAGQTNFPDRVLEVRPPCWFKLSRTGSLTTAALSANGELWQPIRRSEILGDQPLLAGLAVSSQDSQTLHRALFNQVHVSTLPQEETGQAITLRNGSTVAVNIQHVDDIHVKFTSQGRAYDLPVIEVARLHYQPLPATKLAGLAPGRHGVLLRNGDFFDGAVTAIGPREIKVSSVMFGLRKFRVDRDVAVIVLRDVPLTAEPWLVRLYDGTALQTRSFSLSADKLLIEDPTFGPFQLVLSDVAEIVRQQRSP